MSYKVQIDDTIRDATTDEIDAIEARRAAAAAAAAAADAIAAAKVSARAKLKTLGLTDDEVAALVG